MLSGVTRRELIAIAASARFAIAHTRSSITGEGWGLDHIIVGARNEETVKETYFSKLGFTVARGNVFPTVGTRNTNIRLEPAYVEFVWFFDRQKSVDAENALDPT